MVWLLVVVAGSLGLTLCDQLHVHTGVLRYPAADVRIAGQAWWVELEFIAAAVLILIGASVAARVAPRLARGRDVVAGAAWFVGSYAATAAFWHHPRVLAIVIGLAWIDRVALRADRWPLVCFSLALAIVGTLVEGALAGSGAFEYLHADFFHVPFWLPGLYLHGALLAVVTYRYVAGRSAPATTRPAVAVNAA